MHSAISQSESCPKYYSHKLLQINKHISEAFNEIQKAGHKNIFAGIFRYILQGFWFTDYSFA